MREKAKGTLRLRSANALRFTIAESCGRPGSAIELRQGKGYLFARTGREIARWPRTSSRGPRWWKRSKVGDGSLPSFPILFADLERSLCQKPEPISAVNLSFPFFFLKKNLCYFSKQVVNPTHLLPKQTFLPITWGMKCIWQRHQSFGDRPRCGCGSFLIVHVGVLDLCPSPLPFEIPDNHLQRFVFGSSLPP